MTDLLNQPPRTIELRFSMREMLVLHGALRDKQVELEKEAWHLGRRGNAEKTALIAASAAENEALADRLFRTLDGLLDPAKVSP